MKTNHYTCNTGEEYAVSIYKLVKNLINIKGYCIKRHLTAINIRGKRHLIQCKWHQMNKNYKQ